MICANNYNFDIISDKCNFKSYRHEVVNDLGTMNVEMDWDVYGNLEMNDGITTFLCVVVF